MNIIVTLFLFCLIAKRYAFQANAINMQLIINQIKIPEGGKSH